MFYFGVTNLDTSSLTFWGSERMNVGNGRLSTPSTCSITVKTTTTAPWVTSLQVLIYHYSYVLHRYADDTVLIADSEENLQRLLDITIEKSEEMGLTLNVKKTECTVISKKSNSPRM